MQPATQGPNADANVSDEMLMIRYQRGQKDAFTELSRRHLLSVYNFMLRQSRDETQAQNLTCEVFRQLVHQAAGFKHEKRFTPFLYAIAYALNGGDPENEVAPPLSESNLSAPASLELPSTSLSPSIADVKIAKTRLSPALQQAVITRVRELPTQARTVFLLRELAGLRFTEIAEILTLEENVVRTRLRYALDCIRQTVHSFEEYSRALY